MKFSRCVLPLAAWSVLLGPGLFAAEEAVDFNRDIRPLLSDRCFHCHGPDPAKREAELRLDTREGALAPLDEDGEFAALVPRDTEKSELFYRITTDEPAEMMPPPDSNLPGFSEKEIDLVRRWIEQGGDYSPLWTFVPPERPVPPKTGSDWVRNEVDRFILARLEEEGLEPSPEADRRTWIRRVTFDLTGLPPTPGEVEEFLADEKPGAWERVVDRLLASPHHGERMAVEWLDAARYADTSGYQYDWFRTMWRWRDWVIDSFNRNQPYDEFITWQLAGDLLPDATLEKKIATGFNRNHPFTIEGGVIQEEYRVSYVSDRVTTMGTVFLGLTLECARCHDHKYDPISQKDFYQLSAFFNHLPEKGQVGGKPLSAPPAIPAPTTEQQERLDELEKRRETLLATLLREDEALDRRQVKWERARSRPWTIVESASVRSEAGTGFDRQDDASFLGTGEAPHHDVYEVVIPVPARGGEAIAAVRIEALTHDSLVGGGPGRSSNGNAVLTEIEVERVRAGGESIPAAIEGVAADYEQKGYAAAHAIDGKPATGWAFDGNTNHADHWIAVGLAEPVAPGAAESIRVRLRFESRFGRHSFGRIRLATSALPGVLEDGGDEAIRKVLAKAAEKRNATERRKLRRAFRSSLPQFKETVAALSACDRDLAALRKEIPMTMVMSDAAPRETFILERGAYDKPLEPVAAGVPEQLPPLPEGAEANRLGLARWTTDRGNPLTARVTMNRLWSQVFGTGIVKTVNDFGSQAEWPSHRELLDWLAVEFMDSGWDLRHMLRTLVLSATYRQSSHTTPEMLRLDPENRLLARGPRQRLSAEMIRDNALAVSGLLHPEIGGPSVKPYQPPGLWKELTNRKGFQQVYEPDEGGDLYRRGLYTFWKRAAHHPMMSTFDAPNREVCTMSRSSTNTPLQALVLLHDPQFVEAAHVLAGRVMTESGEVAVTDPVVTDPVVTDPVVTDPVVTDPVVTDPVVTDAVVTDPVVTDPVESWIRRGYLLVLAREPRPEEVGPLRSLYEAEKAAFAANPEDVDRLLDVGAAPVPDGVDRVELAATTMVMRALLNLSETITRH